MTVDHYFTPYEGTPPRHSKECSVHTGRKRFEKAKEQASLPPAPLKKIIALVNEFFAAAGMVPCDNPILRLEPGQKVDYKKIQKRERIARRTARRTGYCLDEIYPGWVSGRGGSK